jgi:hypothetical protein
MRKLFIEETFQSPRVTIDPENNIFEIRGNSFPNNAFRLYSPVVEWLDEYAAKPNKETVFVFRISYQNSSSRKMFNEILKRLERMMENGHNVRIDWYYDQGDEDLKQIILEFKHLFKVPIESIAVSE